MALSAGTRLGPYEILAAIGAGGMGEVYRARYTRLGRDVAVKVLPDGLSADPERLQRFEQEARAAAALNHPNILALYDIGTHDARPYLVTELLEGATLREQLSAGPLPVRKTIEYAVQIAHGLAAAHEKGIVHRDLKPENVFVTDVAGVKILDFGLAKLTQPEPSIAGVTALPTTPAFDPAQARPNTLAGVVLGTIGYMSPEQVRGVAADHRSDLFAFGAVLYEMLSGRRAFHGETAMDAMTAIVKDHPPDLSTPERHIPPALVRIVDRCLEKSPAARFQSTRDLAFALEALSTLSTPSGAADALAGIKERPRGRERIAWTIAAALGVVALASLASTAILYLRPVPAEQQSIQFMVSPPDGWTTRTTTGGAARSLAMSPDGRRLAFIAADKDGRTMAWLRSLDSTVAQSLKGTENAGSPFWSPDSQFLAFVTDGRLKKIDVAGGPPQTIADMAASGGTWSPDGTIVFNASGNGGLSRVSAAGGAVSPVTILDQGELRHVNPRFLPDGQHFLYGSNGIVSSIYVGSLNAKERGQLLRDVGTQVAYSQGRLFFTRAGTLLAQGLDAAALKLIGEPSPIAEIPAGAFDVSANGVLAYQSGTEANRSRLAWFDRMGRSLGALGEAAAYYTVDISPDGSHAAGGIKEQGKPFAGDVWLYDLTGNSRTRLTFDAPNTEGRAIWAPDGKHVVYVKTGGQSGAEDLFQKASDGTGSEQPVLEDGMNKWPMSWSPDGRFLLYSASPGSPTTGNDLWVLPLFGDRKPFPYLQTRFSESVGQFSTDGRWVAYQSNESGRPEVYVAAFPGAGGKRQISTAGGNYPRWRRDGKEIFYLAPNNTLMAAAVNGQGASFEVTSVKALFETRRSGTDFPYDVSVDGQRFLIISASDDTGAAGITVVVNGTAGPKK